MEDIQEAVQDTAQEDVVDNAFEDANDTSEENLFDEVEEESKPTETETEAVDEPKPNEPFMKIKYNKEELGLTQEEAIDLAEKGKNYDVLRDKYNQRNSVLEELAKRSNMDVNQLLKTLVDTRDKIDLDNEVKELKKQYPSMDGNALNELAQLRIKDRNNAENQRVAQEQQTKVDNKRDNIKKQVEVFQRLYPNEKPDALDSSVYEMMDANGYTLTEAYQIFKSTQKASPEVKSQNKANEIKESNKKRSLGNITNSGSAEVDDFFKGFNSEF